MTSAPPSASAPAPSPAKGRSRGLSPVATGVIGICVLGIFVVRGTELVTDRAIANILTLVFSFIACVSLTLWFVLKSGFSWRVRKIGLACLFVALALFFTIYKKHRVSGELVPEFRPRFELTSTFPFLRFARPPDELLELPAPAVAAPAGATAEVSPYDFPAFLGPERRTAVDWPAVKLARHWAESPPREVWRKKIGAGWSAFAIRGGLAYTLEQRGGNELVTCYKVDTGELVWSHTTEARHATDLGSIGPRSTPTVSGPYVYTLGAQGEFLCLKADTGDVVWRKNLLEMYGLTPAESETLVAWGRSNSPLVVDDLVIVPGAFNPNGGGAGLVAFHRETGEKVWEGGHEQVSYASPELGTLHGVRQVLINNESTVSGHDLATGKELWQYPWPGHSNTDANASQAHAVGNDRVFISKGYSTGASLFTVNKAGDEWSTEPIWTTKSVMKTKFTNVALLDGYVYGLSDGLLECIALDTGARQWKKGRYQQGQILRVNDLLIVQAESGEVFLVAADPKAHQELGKIPALSGQTWNNPAIFCRSEAGKLHCYLLVRNAEEAACYELPLEQPSAGSAAATNTPAKN